MNGNVYLIGFMGCGKSTVSRCLADRLALERLEMDEMLAEEAGKSIARIFEEEGEEAFRERESRLLRRIAEGDAAVVSCGGGAALRRENVETMKSSGKIVLLAASPETIYQRVKGSKDRPVLTGRMNIPSIAELIRGRQPFYEAAADIRVETDGKSVSEIAEEIIHEMDLQRELRR